MLDKSAQAQKYGLNGQYQAVEGAEQADKAKPLAEFTAAALKEMTKRDAAGGKEKDVTELFELTKAVRQEAGVVPGAEVSALPEDFSAVKSMLQNPLLQKAAQVDDPDKFQEAMELPKIVAKKGVLQVRKVEQFVRGNSAIAKEDMDKVMAGVPNDPEQIRAAMIQMLSGDKEKNQDRIDKLRDADLDNIQGQDVWDTASKLLGAKSKGSGKGLEQPKGKATGVASKAKNKSEEVNSDESLEVSPKQPKIKGKSGSGDGQEGLSQKGQDGRDGQNGQPGKDGQSGQTVVVRDGRDGAPGQNIQSQPASQSQPVSPQQQAPEKGRAGFEAKDIMDADAPSHGSYKTARNIAIVCAILFILSGGAVGIFLLGALLAGGAAVHYKGEMQTEKQQIAKQRNIEQGLLDPAEVRQQQMEQQMSQEMGQLKQQLRGEQQAHFQMQQELHALQQPPQQSQQMPQPHPSVDPSVSPAPGKGSQGADQGRGPQMPRDVSEKAVAVAREKATHEVTAQPEVQGVINALATNKESQTKRAVMVGDHNKGGLEAVHAGSKKTTRHLHEVNGLSK